MEARTLPRSRWQRTGNGSTPRKGGKGQSPEAIFENFPAWYGTLPTATADAAAWKIVATQLGTAARLGSLQHEEQ